MDINFAIFIQEEDFSLKYHHEFVLLHREKILYKWEDTLGHFAEFSCITQLVIINEKKLKKKNNKTDMKEMMRVATIL